MADKKTILVIIAVTIIALLAAVVLLTYSSTSPVALEKTAGAKIEMAETSYDFGEIDYAGGNVEHSYRIKNNGDKQLKVANLVTSCACTKVYFKSARQESKKFSMKGHSKPSDWAGTLNAGEGAEVIAIFDPAAHGPAGVGAVSRVVSFQTNDPGPALRGT